MRAGMSVFELHRGCGASGLGVGFKVLGAHKP